MGIDWSCYTKDEILWGKLKLFQPKDGPRISMDSVLLSWFVKLKPKQRALELGSATGGVSLLVALRNPNALITGIDIVSEYVEVAKVNANINDVNNVDFVCVDIRKVKGSFKEHSFDVVFVNPPYDSPKTGRLSKSRYEAIARQGTMCEFEDIVNAAFFLLKNKGRFFMVMKAKRLTECLCELSAKKIEPKRILMVYPDADKQAELFLLEAVKLGGKGVVVERPLFVYDKGGNYTDNLLECYKL